ncbi:MAG: hypothetical protein FWD32_00455 [Firmicutes bacterium]|nr:hypothetical protein [Bacillota bacterium]
MKKKKQSQNQTYGIVSLIAGALLIVPLFLTALTGKILGSTTTFMELTEVSQSHENMWLTIAQYGTYITLGAAITLLVIGILFLIGKGESNYFQLGTIIAGAIGLVTAIGAIMFALTFTVLSTQLFEVGLGAIMLAIVGIATTVSSFILKK